MQLLEKTIFPPKVAALGGCMTCLILWMSPEPRHKIKLVFMKFFCLSIICVEDITDS